MINTMFLFSAVFHNDCRQQGLLLTVNCSSARHSSSFASTVLVVQLGQGTLSRKDHDISRLLKPFLQRKQPCTS